MAVDRSGSQLYEINTEQLATKSDVMNIIYMIYAYDYTPRGVAVHLKPFETILYPGTQYPDTIAVPGMSD